MRKVALVLLVLGTLLAPRAFAASPEAEKAFAAGEALLNRGEVDKAVEQLERAVALDPNNARYHFTLGSAYGRQAQDASVFRQPGLARKTKAEFERAVELDPNSVDARFALIDYYLIAPGIMGGSEEKAMQQAAEVKKRNALDGHRAYARIYGRQKKSDLARKEYADAVREAPNSPKTHYYYGAFLMLNDKNYKAAADEFETAVKIDPAYMPGWFQIGHVAALAGTNLARGEESLRKYLAYKPATDEPPPGRAWYWLGGVFEKQGKKAEAKQAYQTSLRLAPGAKDVQEALKRLP